MKEMNKDENIYPEEFFKIIAAVSGKECKTSDDLFECFCTINKRLFDGTCWIDEIVNKSTENSYYEQVMYSYILNQFTCMIKARTYTFLSDEGLDELIEVECSILKKDWKALVKEYRKKEEQANES